MKDRLVIWGASGHAMVVADIVRLTRDYEIAGFIDDVNPQRHGESFCGSRVLGGREQLDVLRREGVAHLILGLGDGEARLRLGETARAEGFSLALAIHPRAVIADDASLGAGTVVAAGAVVGPGAQIGENVIINTSASVDHECVIEDGAHICPGVHLGGGVLVGRATWVGIGATVVDGTRIGSGVVVGAGAVVMGDIPDGVVAYGVPAKVIREVKR